MPQEKETERQDVISDIKPLTSDELDALDITEFDYCASDTEVCIDGTCWTTIHELRRLFATVRDELQRLAEARELPTAEQLGRVAMDAYMQYLERTGAPDDEVARPQVGQAILDALTKGKND